MTHETKHTPSPWTTDFNETGGYDCMTGAWVIRAAKKGSVAAIDQAEYGQDACEYSFHSDEAEANARLIAAAPELLEACRAGLQSYISLWESEFQTSAGHHCTHPVVGKMRAAIAKAEGRTP